MKRRGPRRRIRINTAALRDLIGPREVRRLFLRARRGRAALLKTGKAGVNEGAIWRLLAGREYGSGADAPVIATREALQNSRDAIDSAWRRRQLDRAAGRFEVVVNPEGPDSIRWVDNGIGMDSQTVFSKFLSLGDTSKVGAEVGAGGFGIAKAILLGISTTFTWKLHTRDRLYVAEGFDNPIEEWEADEFLQGTSLTVFDVDSKWRVLRGVPLQDRLRFSLSLNSLNPRKGHAGVRIFLEGPGDLPEEVQPYFRGRPKIILPRTWVDEGTYAEVRAYKTQNYSMQLRCVRLDGLYQFHRHEFGTPVDLAFDFATSLAPTDDAYPLTTSRMALSGPAQDLLWEVNRQVREDSSSATEEEDPIVDLPVGESQALVDGLAAEVQAFQGLLDSPEMRRAREGSEQGATAYRAMRAAWFAAKARYEEAAQELEQRRRDARAAQDPLSEEAWFQPSEFSSPPEPPAEPRPRDFDVALGKKRIARRKTRRPITNPWQGIAAVELDSRVYKYARRRPYWGNPARWVPYALGWRLTCEMVLTALGRDARFEIGFLFDDKALAAYSTTAGRPQRLLINLPRFAKMVKTYRKQPLAVASVLHGLASHEITHLLGFGTHDEFFSIRREDVAAETASVLYPLAQALKPMLRLRGAVPGSRRRGRAARARLPSPERWCGSCLP